MVKTRSAGPAGSLRRSARLSGTGSIGQDDFLRLLQDKTTQKTSKKRKRRIVDDDDDDVVVEVPHPSIGVSASNRTKRERLSSHEDSATAGPSCRDRAMKQRELELKRKQEDLDSQAQNLETIMRDKERERTLEFLDDNLQCALCCEIIASPYSPTADNCGHSFCALCLLKWFFSRLHRPCGSWHESVACPVCRAPLPFTPTYPPRDLSTFPFSPNRLAKGFIRAAVDKLASSDAGVGGNTLKVEGSRSPRASRVKKEESVGLGLDTDVNSWLEGGRSRVEWIDRERLGYDEMEFVRSRWADLTPEDFSAIKLRLNV